MVAKADESTGLLPGSSALQTLFETERESDPSPHPPHLRQLAQQIAHNLEFQHLWSDIQIHDFAPTKITGEHSAETSLHHHRKLLPRPLISGLPPQRLYIHPDEQIALLQAQKAVGGTGMGMVLPEREWICPTHLREKWSLRRFGEIFDHITLHPPELGEEEDDEGGTQDHRSDNKETITSHGVNNGTDDDSASHDFIEWRTTKRVLLATLDDDSTVVYYIVHDGIVKPRQN